MKFTDFLKVTVLLFAGVAVALGSASGVAVAISPSLLLTIVGAGWWVAAAVIGLWLGRKPEPSARMRELLASAQHATELPEPLPARVLLNRLWPLGLVAGGAIVLAALTPQVPVVATGYAILFALAMRNHGAAVKAIEERDGVTFYIEPTSPFRAIKLVRTPGWTRSRWNGASAA